MESFCGGARAPTVLADRTNECTRRRERLAPSGVSGPCAHLKTVRSDNSENVAPCFAQQVRGKREMGKNARVTPRLEKRTAHPAPLAFQRRRRPVAAYEQPPAGEDSCVGPDRPHLREDSGEDGAPEASLRGRKFSPLFFSPLFRPLYQRERGHELVEAAKTTFPAAELMKMIGDFDGLIVRR